MIINRWKEQKQVVIKHKDKKYTEALLWKLGVNSTNKEMEWNQGLVKKSIYLKLTTGVLIRSGGLEKNRKINEQGAFNLHLRVPYTLSSFFSVFYFYFIYSSSPFFLLRPLLNFYSTLLFQFYLFLLLSSRLFYQNFSSLQYHRYTYLFSFAFRSLSSLTSYVHFRFSFLFF